MQHELYNTELAALLLSMASLVTCVYVDTPYLASSLTGSLPDSLTLWLSLSLTRPTMSLTALG